jgi:hypothetical protein
MSLTAGSLYLSSYNNSDLDTSTNFTVTLAVPVVRAKKLRVLSATLANLMMPFAENDKEFRYSINGGSTYVTINFPTNRRWTDINAFVTWCNTSGSFFVDGSTFTYDTDKNLLTFVAPNPSDSVVIPQWNYNSTTSVSYNSLYRLGWTNIVPVTGTGSVTAAGFPNVFLRTNVIYVLSNISTDSNNDANVGNIIARIPVLADWGQLINYENVHSDFAAPVFTERIKDINIQLLDEDYQPLVNPNNAYFNLTLGVEY